MTSKFNLSRACALACGLGGILWIWNRYLIEFHPSPFNYDDYNRMFIVPLLLLLTGLYGVYKLWFPRFKKLGKSGFIIGFIGYALLLVGTITEFWVGLLQSKPNAYASYMSKGEMWIGSQIGWGFFLLGLLFILIATVCITISALRSHLPIYIKLLLPFFGVICFLSIFHSLYSYPFALGWMIIGIKMWVHQLPPFLSKTK